MFKNAWVLTAAIALSCTAFADEKDAGPKDDPSVFERTHDAIDRATVRGDVPVERQGYVGANSDSHSESAAAVRQQALDERGPRREDTGNKK